MNLHPDTHPNTRARCEYRGGGESAWRHLIGLFAGGRMPCNCGMAYYAPVGRGSIPVGDGKWKEKNDFMACQYGCQTNHLRAQGEVADRIVQLLLHIRMLANQHNEDGDELGVAARTVLDAIGYDDD